MARRIILKETNLSIFSNPPSGYKFLGFDGQFLSERTSGIVTPIIGTGGSGSGTSGTSGTSGIQGVSGTSGTSGSQGPAGETLSVEGVYPTYTSLTQSVGTSYSITPPNNLSTYLTQDDGHLWIFSTSSTAANSDGWVDMGQLSGPQGLPGTSGTSGQTGTSGTSGQTGTSGTSGSSVNTLVTTVTQTTNYTLTLANRDTVVEMTSGASHSITVPPNSDVAFLIGTQIMMVRGGTGSVQIIAGTGVSIYSSNNNRFLQYQYSGATLIKKSSDGWWLFGDLSST